MSKKPYVNAITRLESRSEIASPEPSPPVSVASLVQQQQRSELSEAAGALRGGDPSPMMACLRSRGLPAELVDLASLALSEAVRLETVVVGDPGSPEALEAERDGLWRCQPATAADAQQIAARRIEVEKEWADCVFRHSVSDDARARLHTLRQFFWSLFGGEEVRCVNVYSLPPAVSDAMRRFPYGEQPKSWLDIVAPPARTRRTVRAAAIFQVK